MRLKLVKSIALRVFAVFILDALSTIGASSLFGVDAITAAFVAGVLSMTVVFQDLARAYVRDGILSKEEIDQAFNKAAEEE